MNPDFIPQGKAAVRLKKEGRKKEILANIDMGRREDEEAEGREKNPAGPKEEKDEKKEENKEKEKIEAKPIAVKRIQLKKLGISCGIVSLGETGPEVLSQGNMIYINQDHPLYAVLYKKKDQLTLHLIRLIAQEIVLMKKLKITAREAFEWQGCLIRDALCGK